MEMGPAETHQVLSTTLRADYRARAVRVGINESKTIGYLMEMIDRHAEEIDRIRNLNSPRALDTPVSRADVIGVAASFMLGFWSGAAQAKDPVKEAVNMGRVTAEAALTHLKLREILGRDRELYSSDDWVKIEEATQKMFPTLEEAREQARLELDKETGSNP